MDLNKMTVHSDIRLLLIKDTLRATRVLLYWECVTVNNKMIELHIDGMIEEGEKMKGPQPPGVKKK